MKKIKEMLNFKTFLVLAIGILIGAGSMYAAETKYSSGQVLYKDSSNKENVLTDTLDDIYSKINIGTVTTADIIHGKTGLSQGKLVVGLDIDYNKPNSRFAMCLYNVILRRKCNLKIVPKCKRKGKFSIYCKIKLYKAKE